MDIRFVSWNDAWPYLDECGISSLIVDKVELCTEFWINKFSVYMIIDKGKRKTDNSIVNGKNWLSYYSAKV